MFNVPLQFDLDLIRRYDRSGPRYTSYPSADRFLSNFPLDKAEAALANSHPARDLSLYFHIPFCETLCFYCGCHRVPTRKRARGTAYVDVLVAELELVSQRLKRERHVRQLHLGGGTPTFLSDEDLARLMVETRRRFDIGADAQCGIEIDPRSVDAGRIAHLAEIGFNRLSMGVQDFDPEVQKAVNRVQSEQQTMEALAAARRAGFRSISVDLIYGLPHQDVARFKTTLDKIVSSNPDRIAVYNYAHMPDRFPAQAAMPAEAMPSPDTKLAILQHTIESLTAAGYVYIGMDHFARADDELALALQDGTLQRNFQGYSTHGDCDMLGFGVSSIGFVGDTFLQNLKGIDAWEQAVCAGQLPVQRGYVLSDDDRRCGYVIQELMCRGEVQASAFRQRFGDGFWEYFGHTRPALEQLAGDGLIGLSPNGIQVMPRGRMLIRHVAMVFDSHLAHSRVAQYSKVI